MLSALRCCTLISPSVPESFRITFLTEHPKHSDNIMNLLYSSLPVPYAYLCYIRKESSFINFFYALRTSHRQYRAIKINMELFMAHYRAICLRRREDPFLVDPVYLIGQGGDENRKLPNASFIIFK
jgi:hypothetical protein